MISSLATAVVAMLTTLLPLLSSSGASAIASIIGTLIQLIPLIEQEITARKQAEVAAPVPAAGIIKNIIAALGSNPATTADQLATLQTLDAQVDSAFEAAASAAGVAPQS